MRVFRPFLATWGKKGPTPVVAIKKSSEKVGKNGNLCLKKRKLFQGGENQFSCGPGLYGIEVPIEKVRQKSYKMGGFRVCFLFLIGVSNCLP